MVVPVKGVVVGAVVVTVVVVEGIGKPGALQWGLLSVCGSFFNLSQQHNIPFVVWPQEFKEMSYFPQEMESNSQLNVTCALSEPNGLSTSDPTVKFVQTCEHKTQELLWTPCSCEEAETRQTNSSSATLSHGVSMDSKICVVAACLHALTARRQAATARKVIAFFSNLMLDRMEYSNVRRRCWALP